MQNYINKPTETKTTGTSVQNLPKPNSAPKTPGANMGKANSTGKSRPTNYSK